MSEETLKDTIDRLLKTLEDRERQIIRLRSGLHDGCPYTRGEVARKIKVDLHYVRRVEGRAVRKLQHPVRSRQLEGFLAAATADNPATPEGRLLQTVFGVSASQRPPNLFNFATSERCQDAFISWLIAWAHHDHRDTNGPLHRTGIFFLNRLLTLHGITPPDKYTYLWIQKHKRIDILVLVNSEIVVLIEDKMDFSEYSNQLTRYLQIVRSDFKGRKPVPIYLKTGYQHDFGDIVKAGWRCFLRRDLLEVLAYGKEQGVDNDIFNDFHARLMHMT
jgi:hypothetical protein